MDLLFEKRRLLDTMSAKPKDKHRAVDHHGNHSDHHGSHSDHTHCNHTHTERCHNGQKSHAHSEMMKDERRGGKPLGGFKPVYLNGCTQPCYCSACIGAMATAYSSVSGRGEEGSDTI